MKEATGEFNMRVVTVVAIAAVGAFFYMFVWPNIQNSIRRNTCQNVCPEGKVKDVTDTTCTCGDGSTVEIENGDEG